MPIVKRIFYHMRDKAGPSLTVYSQVLLKSMSRNCYKIIVKKPYQLGSISGFTSVFQPYFFSKITQKTSKRYDTDGKLKFSQLQTTFFT